MIDDHGNGVGFEVDGCVKRREVVRLIRRSCVTPGAVGLDDMRRSCGLSLWDVNSLFMLYELEAILRKKKVVFYSCLEPEMIW